MCIYIYIYQVLQSHLVCTHKWPFQGWKRDLHLGNQKVISKKLVYTRHILILYIICHSFVYIYICIKQYKDLVNQQKGQRHKRQDASSDAWRCSLGVGFGRGTCGLETWFGGVEGR